MSKGRQLYELQELDLDMDAKREALSRVMRCLDDSKTLDDARNVLAEQKKHLDSLRASQRSGEWEIEDLRTKVSGLEERLYGGTVKNPKELSSIHDQVQLLNKKRLEEEDRVLEIMAEVETGQAELDVVEQNFDALEKGWHEEQAGLIKERDELNLALRNLEQKRNELVSRIDAPTMIAYEELRQKKQGRAVARVEQGLCQGCRIVLPIRELQRARGQELVRCSSCERILFVS